MAALVLARRHRSGSAVVESSSSGGRPAFASSAACSAAHVALQSSTAATDEGDTGRMEWRRVPWLVTERELPPSLRQFLLVGERQTL